MYNKKVILIFSVMLLVLSVLVEGWVPDPPPDIETNIENLILVIDGSTDLTGNFTGKRLLVEIKDGDEIIAWFYYDFTKPLNIYDIAVYKQDTARGSLLINGITLSGNDTKTFYIDNIHTGNTICIIDEDIASITVTDDCANGVKISCDGSNAGYNCTSVDNNTRYKVTGLKHSGVTEYTYTPPSQPPDTGSSGSSGGGGGGGSGVSIKTEEFIDGKIIFEGELRDSIRFMLEGNSNTIQFAAIRTRSVDILVKPIFKRDTIPINQEILYDLDEDGKDDISVQLDSVGDESAVITISLLNYKPIKKDVKEPEVRQKSEEIKKGLEETEEEKPVTAQKQGLETITGRAVQATQGTNVIYGIIIIIGIVILGVVIYGFFNNKKKT